MAIVHRTTPTIENMSTLVQISENVRIVHDGHAILVIVRNSIAGVFDRLANATDFANRVTA